MFNAAYYYLDIHKLYHIRKLVTNQSSRIYGGLGPRYIKSTSLKAGLHMAPKHGRGGCAEEQVVKISSGDLNYVPHAIGIVHGVH